MLALPAVPPPPLELGGFIGNYVAIEVGENKGPKLAAPLRVKNFGGYYIHIPVIGLDLRILTGQLIERIQEKPVGGFNNIGFGDRGYPRDIILFSVLECQAYDPLGAEESYSLEINCQIIGNLNASAAENVGSFSILPEKYPINIIRRNPNWPDIREEVEFPPQGYIGALNIWPGVPFPR